MRRRLYISIAVTIVVVAALTIGLTMARAQEGSDLPALTPTELLASMALQAPQAEAVSGEFSWTNDLLGSAVLQSFHGGPSENGSPGLDLLLKGGSGRLWMQGEAARLESQGLGGDTAAIFDGTTLWIYDSGADTATEYTLPARPDGLGAAGSAGGADPADLAGLATLDLPAKIQEFVDELAPTATLSVTQGARVAARESYTLTMTPTASNTVVGSVQVAVDGETFLPLRMQVFAKGDADPVLSAGFDSVSYEPIDAGVFEFTPPSDATVEQKTVSMPADVSAGPHGAKADGHSQDMAESHKPLTLTEAQVEAGFTLAAPADPSLAFHGAFVIPAHEAPAGGESAGGAADSEAPSVDGAAPESVGPVAVLSYGEGFGTVLLVQAEADAADMGQLTSTLAQVPMLGQPVDVGGKTVYRLDTKLGSAMLWQQDGRVLFAAGMVSGADLVAFVGSVAN